jgi:hypothetical protein
MSDQNQVNGSCLCGTVQFVAALPSKWCAHCHCTLCRKAHGAGYVTWVGFETDQVNFINGKEKLKWYESTPGAQRGFCKQCGSTLFFKSKRWAGELHITLACLDEAIDRQPQANVFFDQHVNWMSIDTTLKQVDG